MLSTSRMEWPGMVSEYTCASPHQGPTRTRAHQVGVAFSGHRRLVRETAGRAVRYDAEPGAVYVTGGQPVTWLEVRDRTEALEIYPEEGLLSAYGASLADVRAALHVRDGVVFAVASRLRRAHLGGGPLCDIEASTLAHLLAARLAGAYAPGRPARASRPPGASRSGGALPSGAVDIVYEHVRGNLDGQLRLEALAASVSSSPFHFARGFKAATGTTPHAYVTEVRMTVARDLLLRSRTPVAEVAAAVGFSNLSHFRRTFRRQHGVGPGELRRP